MNKMIMKSIIVFASIVLILIANSSFVVTRANEFTVLKQFGKIQEVVIEPGLSFKVPMIQTEEKISNQIMIYDVPASDVITSDKKTMIIDSYVLYKVVDPLIFAQTLSNSFSAAEGRINTVVYNATKSVISSMTQEEVIGSRKGNLSSAIITAIGDNVNKYGIELIEVEEKKLDLPDDNKMSVYTRMISEREKIAATYTAQGEKDSMIIKNETDRSNTVLIANAQADAQKLIAEGEAEYMQILAQAYGDPLKSSFYEFVIGLDAAKASMLGGNKTLILPSNSPVARIFQ